MLVFPFHFIKHRLDLLGIRMEVITKKNNK
jgi:hypothetical protein